MEAIPLSEKDFKAFGLAGSNIEVTLKPGTRAGHYQIFIPVVQGKETKTGVLVASRQEIKGKPREFRLESANALVERYLPNHSKIIFEKGEKA